MKDLLKMICRLVISNMVWRVEKVCAGCALLILSFSMTVWSQQLTTDNAHWGEENLSYDVIYQWGFIWKKKGGSLSVTVNSLFFHSNLMLSATRLERLAESSYSRESSITTNTGLSSVYAQAAGLSKAWKPSPTVHMAGAHS